MSRLYKYNKKVDQLQRVSAVLRTLIEINQPELLTLMRFFISVAIYLPCIVFSALTDIFRLSKVP